MLMYLLLGVALAQSSPNSSLEAVPGEYLVKLKSSRSAQALQAKVSGGFALKGQVSKAGLVHLKLDNAQDFQTLSQDPDVEYIEPNYILSKPPTAGSIQTFSEGDVSMMASTTYSQTYAPVQVPRLGPSNQPTVPAIFQL